MGFCFSFVGFFFLEKGIFSFDVCIYCSIAIAAGTLHVGQLGFLIFPVKKRNVKVRGKK